MSFATTSYHGIGNPSFTLCKPSGVEVYTIDVDVPDHVFGLTQSPHLEIEEEQLGEPPRIMLNGQKRATFRGIHYIFSLFWPASDDTGRAQLALVTSWLQAGGTLKFKPHRDNDDEYWCEVADPKLSKYTGGGECWGGYELALQCMTVFPVQWIPADFDGDCWCGVCMGLILDGTNDKVDFGDNAALDTAGDELYIRFFWTPKTTAADRVLLIKAGVFAVYQTPAHGTGSRLEAAVVVSSTTYRTTDAAWTADLVNDHPVEVEVIGDGATLAVYIDGVLMPGSVAYAGNIDTAAAAHLYVGSDAAGSSWAKGTIYMLEIIDPSDNDRYLLRAKFIDGSGTTVHDYTKGQNHGAAAGTPAWYAPTYSAAELSHWCSATETGYAAAEVAYWAPCPSTRTRSVACYL